MHDDPPPPRDSISKKRKTQPANPLIRGIVAFCDQKPHVGIVRRTGSTPTPTTTNTTSGDTRTSPSANSSSSTSLPVVLAISDLPKRYTAYAPLLLLPPSFISAAQQTPPLAAWPRFYSTLTESQRAALFRCITEEGFRGLDISRIAINAPIAASEGEVTNQVAAEEGRLEGGYDDKDKDCTRRPNVLRSPSGLIPVYGDWGPALPFEQHRVRTLTPTAEDFQAAFWTATAQHEGVTQVWAPLYTMFSRGNVSEKARILGLRSWFPGMTTARESEVDVEIEFGSHDDVTMVDVVDMYVGIGYFAFCYLKRGVRRVYGWDINPWSIEGLRRGCDRNGWKCLVVNVDAIGSVGSAAGGSVRELAERIREGDQGGPGEQNVVRCVAFLGDNKWAAKVLQEIQSELRRMEGNARVERSNLNIRHANLGLLPTSRASWRDAVVILTTMHEGGKGGWLHVHENVDMREIERMTGEVVDQVNRLLQVSPGDRRFHACCQHVEQVKTYAPGVMHCVFDVAITSNG
ncbi:hypothetical protein G647_07199 [Cladophialophora carrionii CBS 160.54]|uniref:tRNA(Phe) (4-demethylwyosine(37)-C(7)) aminocarboxypropyltransferase n=1 Tax=Cladophialophora carrionii CBS 160.54 TaxID=1279043 RepID=V9D2M4_9EURO|nr:uncharacterized protein G647_07199 [Cladophialophora carrionii CBS 160.54]ETI20856.1 hypothetical protein G647_07199 [Cladophialophora carrionii CBS 160.54]